MNPWESISQLLNQTASNQCMGLLYLVLSCIVWWLGASGDPLYRVGPPPLVWCPWVVWEHGYEVLHPFEHRHNKHGGSHNPFITSFEPSILHRLATNGGMSLRVCFLATPIDWWGGTGGPHRAMPRVGRAHHVAWWPCLAPLASSALFLVYLYSFPA